MTPLDYAYDMSYQDIHNWAQRFGMQICCNWGMSLTEKTARYSVNADVNVVVSEAGLALAKRFEADFDIPYLVGVPCLPESESVLADMIRHQALSKHSDSFGFIKGNMAMKCDVSDALVSDTICNAGQDVSHRIDTHSIYSQAIKRVLIVGDWVMAASMRASIEQVSEAYLIDIASFFGSKPSWCRMRDTFLGSEHDLRVCMRNGNYDVLIADPLLALIPEAKQIEHIYAVHPAISSDLCKKDWNSCINISTFTRRNNAF